MSERDELIQDKERRVYDLKKNNQELEKFKFVFDHNIKTLKQQVEPREQHIAEMTNHIQTINEDLSELCKEKASNEERIMKYQGMLVESRKEYTRRHRKIQDITHFVKGFKMDVQELMVYIQEPTLLKKVFENLVKKYCPSQTSKKISMISPAVEAENAHLQDILKKSIGERRRVNEREIVAFRRDDVKGMSENQSLLKEINALRGIVRQKPGGKEEKGMFPSIKA
jgi:chromosome segregation ATPase